MDVSIRSAGEDEIGDLLAMYEWLFDKPEYRPPVWDEARAGSALREAILAETSTVLVAEGDGTLIGLCSLYLDFNSVRFGQRCWVGDIAVEPRKRSAGVGKAMLDAAKAWARDHGATHLELNTGLARTDAQRFYEREHPDMTGYCYSWALAPLSPPPVWRFTPARGVPLALRASPCGWRSSTSCVEAMFTAPGSCQEPWKLALPQFIEQLYLKR